MKKKLLVSLLSIVFLTATAPVSAVWTIKKGRLVDASKTATLSVDEHYKLGIEALQEKNYKVAAQHFNIVATCFPLSECAQDANYYLGIALFQLEEFDFANDAFSAYISAKNHPQFFIEAIEYKFCIAEAFRKGACRRPFGSKQLPKWASGQALGLTIYDEVIAALPSHDFAVRALYSKACLLRSMKQYRDSIDALQLVVKRFAKHELASLSYVMIANIYLEQCEAEFQNPDLIAFSEINLRRFKEQFPRDEKICEAESIVLAIKETYAKGLYETGQFYERIEKTRASIIYYKNVVDQFPETNVAKICEERLKRLMKPVNAS
ncbi:MAG TPA: outer membrane protein assembly factor BamD [Parachlamydiaceae bacterium]|nr:outer membrane protein assembly factor BamD [Parachlamydiaceae bacterium]